MRVYLPNTNDDVIDNAKVQYHLALKVTGFEQDAPNECHIATTALAVILEQLDPIAAAVISMWANDETDTVTIPLTYEQFHKEIIHILVRLAYAGGWCEGQAALLNEALETLDEAFDDAFDPNTPVEPPYGDPELN